MIDDAFPASHPYVVEARFARLGGGDGVTAVEEHRDVHGGRDAGEVQRPELVPLGQQQDGVRSLGSFVGILAHGCAGQLDSSLLHRHRIVGPHRHTFPLQRVNYLHRECFPDVVGIRLEGYTPDCDDRSFQIAEVIPQLLHHSLDLAGIHFHHRLEQAWLDAVLRAHVTQREHVFREATPTISDPRTQERAPDAPVEAHPFGDQRAICVHPLADVRHLVYEADLGGRNALDAYLTISAVRVSAMSIGAPSGSYSSLTLAPASSSFAPTTTRSGRIKSRMAEPSLRNSGLETTGTDSSAASSSASSSRSASQVPTGAVLLLTMIGHGS